MRIKCNSNPLLVISAILLGLIFCPLPVKCQPTSTFDKEVKFLKVRMTKFKESTLFSGAVEDMYFDCVSRKLVSRYMSLSAPEKVKVKKMEYYATLIPNFTQSCIKEVMQEVGRINNSKNIKLEIYRESVFKNYLNIEIDKEFKSDSRLQGKVDKASLCDCIYNKVKFVPFKNGKLMDIGDPNGQYSKEVLFPCVKAAMIASAPKSPLVNDANNPAVANTFDDVSGPLSQQRIETSPFKGARKVAFSIGDHEYDGIIDSGASYLVITPDMERDLLIDGVISKASYLESITLEVADGRSVNARVVIIPTLKLGSFSVKNVEACIVPTATSVLLGKSLLNKFRRWSVDNETSELTLDNRNAEQRKPLRFGEGSPYFSPGKTAPRSVCKLNPLDEGKVYTSVDKMPAYPGGAEMMRFFITNSIQKKEDPLGFYEGKTKGLIYVRFTVDCAGNVKDAKIAKQNPALAPDFHTEALRVINSLPAFSPGIYEGRQVDVELNTVVEFK